MPPPSAAVSPAHAFPLSPAAASPLRRRAFFPRPGSASSPRCLVSIRCSVSAVAEAPGAGLVLARPSPAEVSRTVMELSGTGTLSTVTEEGWPLGIGARFVVDGEGTPALCLNSGSSGRLSVGSRSSFHVQLEQSGSRTPQCTLLGNLNKPEDVSDSKKLHAKWEKKFGEQLDMNLIYLINVERVLHMDDFKECGTWVTSSEYLNAEPDPLRNFAEELVDEMNSKHSDDVQRLCHAYVDTDFQVMDAKLIWVDRLGFDLHIYSQGEVFEARIPFPRGVSDEKGVKSSFNCMCHLAWEVEKTYATAEFERVKFLKRIR